jgi:transcriptional/translational regulatory protein YebC/TACO1
VLYEGTGPCGTLFLVEGMTDNRNRTAAEIRKLFERNNGMLGGGGAAGWAFERKGVVRIAKPGATEDQLMEIAVGAGADDYAAADEEWHVTTAPEVMNTVVAALEAAKIAVAGASLAYLPKAKKQLSGRDAEVAINLAEALDDHDDVQNVYADFDISDEDLALLAK